MGPSAFLIGLMALGAPIALAFAAAALIALDGLGLPLSIIPQRLFGSMDSFTLLSIPLFILAGELMSTSGISQRLVDLASAAVSRGGPVVLGGSSLGAYVSAIASLQVPTRALFLMVPPLGMGPMPALDAAPVPLSVVHAWHDELIPAAGVIEWARARSARLLLLDDSHRLSAHVDATARAFAELLESLPA